MSGKPKQFSGVILYPRGGHVKGISGGGFFPSRRERIGAA
jgi:hypothetical protein